ncbi:MAG: ABC transporter ATP-binding protein [Firmicutes bacterium]|jgi:ABC-type nitrate/sulfonate/bicarbonate transport system ATPase subunit|nr:ABC transporter ATP-binding protein [Bacillota bacterium]
MLLKLDNISSTYTFASEILPVLEEVSLRVNAGEFVSLLGPSGSGKSTLLKIAAGLLEPDHGQVFLKGKEITGRPAKVGYMPQQDLLFPWKTLLQNAAMPLLAEGKSKEEASARVCELLPVFGLEGFASYYPGQLSGGMKQRAALLRTVLMESNLMLLDEPFAALDALTRENLREWLLRILDRFRRAVLFVTHSIDEAIYLSDRIYMISDRPGKIILEITVEIPRPRSRKTITSSRFISYREQLMDTLATLETKI